MRTVILGHADTEKLSRLYADAFSGDALLMRTYKLRPCYLPGFFRVLHRLFFSDKPVMAIGLEDNGELVSATTLVGSDFRAGLDPLLSAINASTRELGITRGFWFWLINIYQGILSAPVKSCWQLLS
ncbi:MAG: hypothetical protein ABIM46_02895 [candidate division WOR-3 bacterium]